MIIQFIAAEQSPDGSVFRAIYVLLSVHIRGLIKIFWYVCKVRGQVRAGQQNFVQMSTKFCPEVNKILSGSCVCIALATLLLLSKSNVEDCVQTYSVMCSLLFCKMSLFAYGSIHQGQQRTFQWEVSWNCGSSVLS